MGILPFLLLMIAPSFARPEGSRHDYDEADDNDVDVDEKTFLKGIAEGKGLYWQFPYVQSLNNTNFDRDAKGKPYSWVIEFYNSWCGDCMRFNPTYKRLSLDIKRWRPAVRVGAVDCSNQLNTPLCRTYNVLYYPTVKYFPPFFADDFYGDVLHTGSQKMTLNQLRVRIVVRHLLKRQDLPQLRPWKTWNPWEGTTADHDYVLLIVEKKPILGPEIALDYWSLRTVKTIFTSRSLNPYLDMLDIESPEHTSMYLFFRPEPLSAHHLLDGSFSRARALSELRPYFEDLNIDTPKPFNLSLIRNLSMDTKDKDASKIKAHQTDIVFQADIEGAMRQTLNVEIPQNKYITDKKFAALKKYIILLKKYFPIGKNGKNFIQCILDTLKNRDSIKGMEFSDNVKSCEKKNKPVYLDPNGGWMACRGSFPMFRGYPCSLWTTFHTLTVQAYNKSAANPREVLEGMVGYIGNFFGCSDCAKHFLGMAKTMKGNVTNLEDSVLWLWKAHNSANKRLHGDPTEDPVYPKVQFPPIPVCPRCRDENGHYVKKEVLAFLKRMYMNISQTKPSDVYPTIK